VPLTPEERLATTWMIKDLLRDSHQLAPPADLDAIASHIGVQVTCDWADPSTTQLGWSGRARSPLRLAGAESSPGAFEFDGESRSIRLSPNLYGAYRRLVFAHELAHAYFEHDDLRMLQQNRLAPSETFLEDQAAFAAHQIVTGVETFSRSVESSAGGHIPRMREILHVRHMFQIAPYVAFRSYVEHARRPTALLSLIIDGDAYLRVVGHASATWAGPVCPGPSLIRIVSDDALAWRASILINRTASSAENEHVRVRDIVRHARERCQANKVDFIRTRTAVHLIMHRV
jgi:hypothetical protein